MSEVKLVDDGPRVIATAPYHPEFLKTSHALNGTWDEIKKVWIFDCRDRAALEDAMRRIYGTAGEAVPLVNIRLRVSEIVSAMVDGELYLLGRMIARRSQRDLPVKLGEGVIVVEGLFSKWGGSMKHPRLEPTTNLVLEVRDVPIELALRTHREHPAAVSAAFVATAFVKGRLHPPREHSSESLEDRITHQLHIVDCPNVEGVVKRIMNEVAITPPLVEIDQP